MALGDARAGAVDWLANAVGPSTLTIEQVPGSWVGLSAQVMSSLDTDGVVLQTATVGQTGSTVTVSLTAVQVAALDGTVWWRLMAGQVPVLAGRFRTEAAPSASWSKVTVVVGGNVTVVVSGASGASGGAGGVSDHGALTGLSDDDHVQYLTTGRHGAIGGNPHGTTAAQVGADPAGTSSSAIIAHSGASDPHGDRAFAAGAVAAHVAADDPHPVYLTQLGGDARYDLLGAAATVAAGAQPLDSDLTAIAALATTAFGRSLLTLADAAAGRSTLGAEASGVAASLVALHEADTTAVHGIADTSALVVTSDGRLSDARTPTTHAGSHGAAGSDPVAVTAGQVSGLATVATSGSAADLSGTLAPARIAAGALVATAKLSATGTKDATTFLRGDDTWAVPAGGGSGPTNYSRTFQLMGS